MPHFATIAEPLTEFTKAKNPEPDKVNPEPDKVNPEPDKVNQCEKAFCKLKELLLTTPI